MAAEGLPAREFNRSPMKRFGLIPSFLAATLFLAAGLPAQEPAMATTSPAASQRTQALLKRFDKNGDGQLDESERADMRKYFLARFDKNGDGRLDEDERAAMREEFKAQAKALKLKNQ